MFQVGPPKALYERPENRFVADFIGINNLIEGTIESMDEPQRGLRVKTGLGELYAVMDERFRPGDRCVVSIRPENAALDSEPAAERNLVKGRIAFAAYLGHTLRYDVDLGQSVVFKVDIRDLWHHEPRAMGSAVAVSFPASSTVAIPAEA